MRNGYRGQDAATRGTKVMESRKVELEGVVTMTKSRERKKEDSKFTRRCFQTLGEAWNLCPRLRLPQLLLETCAAASFPSCSIVSSLLCLCLCNHQETGPCHSVAASAL